jgi:hypothetical protein
LGSVTAGLAKYLLAVVTKYLHAVKSHLICF